MNKEFSKVTLLTLLVIICIGLIALAIPGCDSHFIKIKPLKWFGWLLPQTQASADTTSTTTTAEAENLPSTLTPLQPFLDKLKNLGSVGGQIRIAYFGDSIIEGDLITQQLRDNLQSLYGGSGVGFVPITSIVANFRKTIRQTFAKNWETLSFMSPYKAAYPLGISGYVFIPRNYYTVQKAIELAPDSLADSTAAFAPDTTQTIAQRFYLTTPPWVKYQTANIKGGSRQFDRIRLFYSHSQPGASIRVSVDNLPPKPYTLAGGTDLQTLDLSAGYPAKSLTIEAPYTNPAHFYGVSFDQPGGVFVDNFPIRGFSGMYFQRIPKTLLQQFQTSLQYDLIVLQYGENVSNPKFTSYEFYLKGMVKTIRYLQSAFPGVPILMVSAHDRSIKTASGFKPSPDIPYLVKTQAAIADSTGCAFWNLYETMGGSNSMQKYVNSVPPLAAKDYTHFNLNGANRIANMLTDAILGRKK